MGMASRVFNKKMSLEKEIKDVYAKFSLGEPTEPTATWQTTTPIVLQKANTGTIENTGTVTLQVAAAAANPTNTILINVTGTAAAIVITVTPNNGTNNTATPVPLTTAQLVEFISTGAVTGKTVTVTDSGSLLLIPYAATGGDATNLADGGEGDGLVASWGGASDTITNSSVAGIASIVRNAMGDYSIILQDAYHDLKNFKAIILDSTARDLRVQLKSESVSNSSTKEVRFLLLSNATPVNPPTDLIFLVKLELKNTSVV
jgi:hypothetical protein